MLNLIDNLVLVAVLGVIGMIIITVAIILDNCSNKKRALEDKRITAEKEKLVDERSRH